MLIQNVNKFMMLIASVFFSKIYKNKELYAIMSTK